MGLDWHLDRKAKPGQSERVRALRDEVSKIIERWQQQNADDAESDGPDIDAHMKEIAELTTEPIDELHAPKIGFDDAADRWLQEQLDAYGRGAAFASARERMRGTVVVALAEEKDAIPIATGMLGGDVDFRGQLLISLDGYIAPRLVLEACEPHHDPAAVLAYADALAAARLDLKFDAREPPVPKNANETRVAKLKKKPARNWVYFVDKAGDVVRKRDDGDEDVAPTLVEKLGLPPPGEAFSYAVGANGVVTREAGLGYARVTKTKKGVAEAHEILDGAVRWLRFWGGRGYGFSTSA